VHLFKPSHFKCFSRQATHALDLECWVSTVVELVGTGCVGDLAESSLIAIEPCETPSMMI
jgi:hypothetical protein